MANTAAFQVNMRELRDLYSAVRAAQPDVAKEIRGRLREGGEAVRLAASRNAWAFSTRIPGTVKIRTNAFNVTILAGGDGAPHAAPFEHQGNPGFFRHPVFGNREVWVAQKAHPFLQPAFESKQEALVRGVIAGLDVILNKAGLE